MRLFVAVDVPGPVKEAIEHNVVDALRPKVEGARWTRDQGRHLTLKFLGEVDEARLDEIAGSIEIAAAKHTRFDAAFQEIGGFPTLRRPRVLWVGIGTGAEPMRALAGDVEAALAPLGFPTEDRPFSAHLTLARFPRPKIIEVPPVHVPTDAFTVNEIVLFRSQLHPKGARYTALHRLPLR